MTPDPASSALRATKTTSGTPRQSDTSATKINTAVFFISQVEDRLLKLNPLTVRKHRSGFSYVLHIVFEVISTPLRGTPVLSHAVI